jgi:hypothetical protein
MGAPFVDLLESRDATKRLRAVELSTGLLSAPRIGIEIFSGPDQPIEGVRRFPRPLDNWFAYRLMDCLGLRLVDEVIGEVEVVFPEKIKLGPDEDLLRAFYERVNSRLEYPLPATPEQLKGDTQCLTMERPTWIGSEAGMVRDLASILTFHGAKWDPGNTHSVAIFWAHGETKDEPAMLALDPFDCVLDGLVGYGGDEYVKFQVALRESLRSLEGAILERKQASRVRWPDHPKGGFNGAGSSASLPT